MFWLCFEVTMCWNSIQIKSYGNRNRRNNKFRSFYVFFFRQILPSTFSTPLYPSSCVLSWESILKWYWFEDLRRSWHGIDKLPSMIKLKNYSWIADFTLARKYLGRCSCIKRRYEKETIEQHFSEEKRDDTAHWATVCIPFSVFTEILERKKKV